MDTSVHQVHYIYEEDAQNTSINKLLNFSAQSRKQKNSEENIFEEDLSDIFSVNEMNENYTSNDDHEFSEILRLKSNNISSF